MNVLTRRAVLAGSATLFGSACAGAMGAGHPDGGEAGTGSGRDAGADAVVDVGADVVVDAALVWNVPTILFVAGNGGTFDLRTTLPAGIATGGAFDVEATAGGVALPALPAGVTLDASGVLTNAATVAASVMGIVFGYTVA